MSFIFTRFPVEISRLLCTPFHGRLMHSLSYILCLQPRTAFRSHSTAQSQCGRPLGITVHLQGPHVSISAPGFLFLPHLSSGVEEVQAIPTLRLQTWRWIWIGRWRRWIYIPSAPPFPPTTYANHFQHIRSSFQNSISLHNKC